MITQELQRVSEQLNEVGHALTSFEQLGIEQYGELATDLNDAVRDTEQQRRLDESEPERTGMLMFREEAPLAAGRRIITPIAEVLFSGNEAALRGLGMYAVNHYRKGDFFNPHQDHFDGTVMITTTMGERNFDIYEKEPEDDVFKTIAHSYKLKAGSIALLNGFHNLGHAAQCTEGPSVSVVADVPVAMDVR